MFDPTSRYAAVADRHYEDAQGRRHVYKARRFPPVAPPETTLSVRVRDGERLDGIAARTLGDPLAFWRIADANGAMNPFDLLRPGSRLDIPAATFTRPVTT